MARWVKAALRIPPGRNRAQTIPSQALLVDRSLASRRFNMMLLGVFAGVALLWAAVGHYGVMTYSVSWHTQEIGRADVYCRLNTLDCGRLGCVHYYRATRNEG